MSLLARDPSELHAEFLSNNSLDPWIDVNSGPRKVMFAGHLPQALVINGAEERYWQTGTEKRFGEYCFSVKAPCDMEILRVIERFPRNRVYGSSIKNPQTIVIYMDLKTHHVGCLDMRDFSLEHQYFGFTYRKTPQYHRIREGESFEKGTEFLVSPSIKEGGGYGYGLNLTFATMSHPAGADDGILIARSALEKAGFSMIETRVGSWGQNRFGVNMFGKLNDPDPRRQYQIFKNVGEKIRPDGLLMATREFDERLAVTSMGIYDTMMLDMTYDELLYTRPGNGEIVDIMVYHDTRSLPNGMNAQVEFYKDLTDRFYRDILNEYESLYNRFNKKMIVTDEFHQLVLEACAMTDYDIGDTVQKLHHKQPIDDWRVEFKIKYPMIPDIGNKMTGCAGDKGVNCMVVDDIHMPINEYGVRADVVMSSDSPFNRQNFGGLYESYFNQVTREFLTTIRGTIRIDKEEEPTEQEVLDMMEKDPATFDRVWEDLIRLYGYLSPTMYEGYTSVEFDNPKLRALHLSWLFKFPCIHILSPTHNMTPWRAAVKACENDPVFKPRVSRVTYTDFDGNPVTTDEPIEIGHKYFMLLEKISDDWIAVSTAKVNHTEVLGQVTSGDKYSSPAKTQAVKAISEAELRIIMSNNGGEVAADLLDRNNSLQTHRNYVHSILTSKTPTNIERGVDREKVPLGNNRALKLFKHILDCSGYRFVWKDYVDPDIKDRPLHIDKKREKLSGFKKPWVLGLRVYTKTAKVIRSAVTTATQKVREILNLEN